MAKDRLLFLLSLGCLGILAAFLFGNSRLPEQPQNSDGVEQQVREQVTKVLIAQRKLNPGTHLTPSTYKWEEVAVENVSPTDVVHNPALELKMEEAVIVNEVQEGKKINRLDVLWPQEAASKEGKKSKSLPLLAGKVAVVLGVSSHTPELNYLKPGGKANIIFTSDKDQGLGQVSVDLFEDVRILALGTQMEGKDKQTTVMLELLPSEAKVFNFAKQAGTLSVEIAKKIDQEEKETNPLRDQLLSSNSSLNFNSILVTYMVQTLFPKEQIKITTTPNGYIVTGQIEDPTVADKITKVLESLTKEGDKGVVDLMDTPDKALKPDQGKLSVMLEMKERFSIAFFLKPGMYVDMIFSTKSASGFGAITLPLLKNIKVLSIGRPSRRQQPLPPSGPIEILLEMTPHEAEIFTYAEQAGTLTLALVKEEGAENQEQTDLVELRDLLLTSADDGTFHSLLATHMVKKLFPRAAVTVTATPRGFIAAGKVYEAEVAEKIRELFEKLSLEGEKDFVDLMEVVPQQVLICVRVLEVAREVKSKLGINWKALYENADYRVALAAVFPRPLPTDANYFLDLDQVRAGNFTLDAIIDMIREDGRGKVLAEPNLTTISGQPAHFFSGGEFPILIPQGGALLGTVTVEYKKFGVMLDFTPYVELNGLITLHIAPEVSTIDEKNSVKLQGFVLPSLIARKVETTIKLWPGQCYAIAGLMQYDKLARYNSLYCLYKLPIIGPLFRSKEFIEQRTELMFVITPYLIYSDEAEKYTHYQ